MCMIIFFCIYNKSFKAWSNLATKNVRIRCKKIFCIIMNTAPNILYECTIMHYAVL